MEVLIHEASGAAKLVRTNDLDESCEQQQPLVVDRHDNSATIVPIYQSQPSTSNGSGSNSGSGSRSISSRSSQGGQGEESTGGDTGSQSTGPLSNTKNGENMDICFERITYNVSLGWRGGTKTILRGLHGRLPARQLIALMGPSGAGKSSLLDVLSGYRITGVEGSVYVNGRPRNLEAFRRSSAYITQDDRLQPLLTVHENMRVSADLKLGTDTPKSEKNTIIMEILTTLGLYEHLNTQAGRLSGGQRKRLSIALELVNNPTVLFLDEPTTGLDSSSCTQVCNLLKLLARQGRTIICTIHQPSASLFQLFDLVYVLAAGECLYQGSTANLVPYLANLKMPCPVYHNPADYIIELACGEYGHESVRTLVEGAQNGVSLKWFDNPDELLDNESLRKKYPLKSNKEQKQGAQATSQSHQLKVLMQRGWIKVKRDTTLTYLRMLVNILTGMMLGSLFIGAGNDATRIHQNYNLLFGCLIHHMMSTQMLTVLTFPQEMNILKKEHFNRWYSLKAYYTSITLLDIPVSVVSCFFFSVVIYFMSDQPHENNWRFPMFFVTSLFVVFVAQSFGLMIGACCDVVNGTFLAPTLSVPMMMFAGFGVMISDLPAYLHWGSYISYLRYGLEGYVNAIYGLNRPALNCVDVDPEGPGIDFCFYKEPKKFVNDVVGMSENQFWNDMICLTIILIALRLIAFVLLRWKLMSTR
ncbi:ATP-binding cassette sub-family G member 4-like isoform X2 [Trichogramma pretiosum]|uniref:ATP-binding cassette sub-family G member 4-like isoform X2 n=1 Tax=Trichogramma pretiosum TaxID=7493 RepID=UPI0006C954D6|nr:ATP-binding cassette sub-family G member 4-like isoform X2 [Trichogramma pretiosum]